jgi:CubicO group peptidase (beta-lactamase class C family)
MNTGSKDNFRRPNRYDIILWLTVLIAFAVLEIFFIPGTLQPLMSLALGALLLGIFWRKKLVTRYAVSGLAVLTGAFTLVNLGILSLQVSGGQVDPGSPWVEIDRLLEEHFTGSALVAVDGRPYLERSYAYADRSRLVPNTPQTQFMIGSTTKMFTAMGIMILRDRGMLELSDPICLYLPDCPPAWQPVNIEHLLTHTSGIPDFTQILDPQVPEGTTLVKRSILKVQAGIRFFSYIRQPATAAKIIVENRDNPLEFEPGARFKYSNTGYLLLGYIIERVSGQPYDGFIVQEIFIPLQMTASGYGKQSPDLAVGYINTIFQSYYIDISRAGAAGGLHSTTGDLLKWDQALDGELLVKKSTLDEIFAPRVPIDDAVGQRYSGLSYSYGWMVGWENEHPVAMHGGSISGYLSNFVRYPQDKVTIILLTNDGRTNLGLITNEITKQLGLR